MPNLKHPLIVLLAGLAALAVPLVIAYHHRTLYDRHVDPSGRYVVETTIPTLAGFIPRGPGQGSDIPVFVEIFTRGGRSLGRVPVPMLQMSGVQWEGDGAYIPNVAAWDFKRGDCYYWDEDDERKVYVKGRG